MISAIALVLFVLDKYTINTFSGDTVWALEQPDVKQQAVKTERQNANFNCLIFIFTYLPFVVGGTDSGHLVQGLLKMRRQFH